MNNTKMTDTTKITELKERILRHVLEEYINDNSDSEEVAEEDFDFIVKPWVKLAIDEIVRAVCEEVSNPDEVLEPAKR